MTDIAADRLAELRDDYLAALVAGDAVRARWLIEHAVDGGADVADLYLHVLAPSLRQIGHLWAGGTLNVAYEHHATNVTQGLVARLGPRMHAPPAGGRLAVVACTPGELHAVGAQMVADFLEAAGWEVLMLGPATPAPDLAALVDAERPDVVALSTAMDHCLPEVERTVQALRSLDPPPFVVVGGRAWDEGPAREPERFGADVVATDPRVLVRLLEERFPPVVEDE
jgi:methanogenic corrinoid protein MtbC1